nr:zinc finger protein 181-like isoform X1 [Megalopta genalis]XP_033333849.1 zinc finger protein 181-like isoform X1 [Megalopta genalis]
MFTRRIPNILKSSPKKHRDVEEISSEIVFTNIEENAQEACNPIRGLNNLYSEETCLTNDNNCRKSVHRRKQEHDFIDRIQKSSNWNICTFLDEKTEAKKCKERKRVKRGRRKQNSESKVPAFETEKRKESSVSLTSDDKSVEFVSEFNVAPYLNEIESMDLEGSIDFSSNEIFSNFNYELYYNSGSTVYDSEICEKQYDMNSNEVGIDKAQYSILSEHWNEDLPYHDKKSNCSSNLCCSYCNEDYAATVNEETNMTDEIMPENTIIDNSEINCQVKLDRSYLPAFETDIGSTNEFINEGYSQEYNVLPLSNVPEICTLSKEYNEHNSNLMSEEYNENSSNLQNEEYNESSSNLLISNTPEIVSQYLLENMDSLSSESTISCTEEDIEEEILREQTAQLGRQCNMFNDIHDDFFHSLDLSRNSLKSEKVDTLKSEVYVEEDTIDDEFQCLRCPLTFISARSMAMHQTGAHGGTYIILCESCGRLFNRKYHFNRHFIHCGRFKEPYKCEMCKRIYKHRSTLVQHLKTVHKVQYTRRHSITYTCHVCNKQYSKFGAFENHVKRH